MNSNKYIAEIIQNPDDPEESLLQLPNELLEEMKWLEGDNLLWIDNTDGTWSLKKKE